MVGKPSTRVKGESALPKGNPNLRCFLCRKPAIFLQRSSSGNHGSNYNQSHDSPSNSRKIYWSSGSNRYPRSSAGNPSSRYSTGPFSYENLSMTARCTSSSQSYTCGQVSSVRIQRMASYAVCVRLCPCQCSLTSIRLGILTKCINCQPSHRREPNGDLTRLTRRD